MNFTTKTITNITLLISSYLSAIVFIMLFFEKNTLIGCAIFGIIMFFISFYFTKTGIFLLINIIIYLLVTTLLFTIIYYSEDVSMIFPRSYIQIIYDKFSYRFYEILSILAGGSVKLIYKKYVSWDYYFINTLHHFYNQFRCGCINFRKALVI